jgi:CobQ-like glutamine amidotransferase family enzyme
VKRFTVGWLYPDLMNIYGDRGNVVTLLKRAEWRGIDARLVELRKGWAGTMEDIDVFFFGGGQDREQALVYDDLLERKALPLGRAIAEGAAMLAVCGGYQLLGRYYQTAEGDRYPGIGLVDLHTVGGGSRCIGNAVIDVSDLGLSPSTLVGFENHSGRTFLGEGVAPLGQVRSGFGNNGEDGAEGLASGNIFGTYLHGSLLPKNPHLADLILRRALSRRGIKDLSPLDDSLEIRAHHAILDREPAARP